MAELRSEYLRKRVLQADVLASYYRLEGGEDLKFEIWNRDIDEFGENPHWTSDGMYVIADNPDYLTDEEYDEFLSITRRR